MSNQEPLDVKTIVEFFKRNEIFISEGQEPTIEALNGVIQEMSDHTRRRTATFSGGWVGEYNKNGNLVFTDDHR